MAETTEKYERLIAAARDGSPAVTIVAHPCDETSLRGAIEAAAERLIEPVLVGPEREDPRRRRRARHRPRRPPRSSTPRTATPPRRRRSR